MFELLSMGRFGAGTTISASKLDEKGWASPEPSRWNKNAEFSLADMIAKVGAIPAGEAEEIASGLMEEWERRGELGERGDLTRADYLRSTPAVIGGIGVFVVLPLILLGFLVWLLISSAF